MEQETKKCPYCGEEIMAEAKKCKHCGEWLEPKEGLQATPTMENNELQSMLAIVKRVKEATGVSLADAKEAVDATGDFNKAMAYLQEKEIPQDSETPEYVEEESFFAHHVVKNCNPLFQFSDKLSRKDYWLGSVVLGVVTYSVIFCFFILYLSGFLTNVFGRGVLGIIITMIVLPIIVALGMMVRRLHDIEKSGWLVLLSFVPIANFYLLYLLCLKGQTESGKTTHKPVDYVCWVAVILIPIVFAFIYVKSESTLLPDDNETEELVIDNEHHGVLSVSDAIRLVKNYGDDVLDNKEEMEKYGYIGQDYYGETVWCKNCTLAVTDESPIPTSADKSSSYIYIDYGQLRVVAYDRDVLYSWLTQLKDIGYNETDKSESDIESILTYEKSGNPTIWVYIGKDECNLRISLTDMDTNTNTYSRLSVQNVEYWDNLKPQSGNTYEPTNMLDGNPSTAWAVNLDRASYDSDKLYGPTFTVRCKKLSHIVIRNGYAKDDASFRNNSRASRIIFCNADKVSDENESASYLYEGIVKDTPEPQTLKVNGNANSDIHEIQMIFPIDGLRRGAKWNDLCISEVEFWGWE